MSNTMMSFDSRGVPFWFVFPGIVDFQFPRQGRRSNPGLSDQDRPDKTNSTSYAWLSVSGTCWLCSISHAPGITLADFVLDSPLVPAELQSGLTIRFLEQTPMPVRGKTAVAGPSGRGY
jgi:hypothetical protein